MNPISPPKIIHLITGLDIGGAEMMVLELCKHTQKDQPNPIVVSLDKRAQGLISLFKKNNISVYVLNMHKGIAGLYSTIKRIKKIIFDEKIQIIHTHLFHAMVVASLVKIICPKIKIIWTSHSINIGSSMREIISFFLRPFRLRDILLFDGMEQYYHINNQRIIPNGVDLEKYSFKSTKFEKFTFLAIGRLERVKNFQILVKMMRALDAKTQLIIVGEGDLRESIEKLILQYGIETRIKLLGYTENIAQLMKQSHCLLIPSKWEGMPLVLLEAGAAHLPVIATPVGGIPIILDNDSGYIVPQEKFNEKMQFVYSHYELAEGKAQKFYNIVRNNYHIKLVSKRHSELYKEVLIA